MKRRFYIHLYQCIIGAFLLIFIFSIFLINLAVQDKTFSENENRRLETRPSFTLDQLLKNKFTSNYEKYVADQFFDRDSWIKIKSDIERLIGKKENNGVYLGQDDFLMQKFNKPKMLEIKEKVEAINAFAILNQNKNIYFLLVPTKVTILKDKLPAFSYSNDQIHSIERVKKSLSDQIKFVDSYPVLFSKNKEYIFYKTDHHWTTKGAYYVYRELSQCMGLQPHERDDFHIKNVTDDFYGSLYSKSGYRGLKPDNIELYIPKRDETVQVKIEDEGKEKSSLYDMKSLNKKDKYNVFLGGNHSLIEIKSNIQSSDNLLIIKDSYANSLIPFLTEHFSNIYVVDLRYYTENLNAFIKEKDIQNIVFLYNANTFFEEFPTEFLQ